ncbi:IGR protein motif-domain-containing protein [Scheffersomyces coipomensis]|uniref:IGR protein motif-domain-containing protein n=1 Tax=Scheffersomyces coipomensis TaxID=1788519 RepID=UPI00315DF359
MNGLRSSFLRAVSGISHNNVFIQRQSPILSSSFKSITNFNPIISKSSFSTSSIAFKTNTSTRTKENVHDLETFFNLIGRNTIEHVGLFESDLAKFLNTTSSQMKNMGIDVSTRRYMLRWKHKFVNDLEPLREHKRGKKKNGGERNAKTVIAKRNALKRLEEREKNAANEADEERIF